MKTMFMFAILSSITAAPVMAESFTRDGFTYHYSIKTDGEHKILSGRELSSGKTFRLRIKGTKVAGTYGNSAVQFKIAADSQAANATGAPIFAAK